MSAPSSPRPGEPMFFFFSNRLGCLGSLGVSLIGTALLVLLLIVTFNR
jgi:hypothetical protein